MNEILTWIVDAIFSVIGYGILAAVGIMIFGALWPHIADMVKLLTIGIPVAIIAVLLFSGEFWLAIQVLIGAIVVVGILCGIYSLLDRAFGVLVSEEEAERMME